MLPPILQSIEDAGYAVFSNGPFDLNLFGIRSPNTQSNSFDDLMGCAYQDSGGSWHVEYWPATTDPGTYWLENPGNVNGTAILVPGQYRGVYSIDKHANAYYALCQRNGPVKVWRDDDKNDTLDWTGEEHEGYYGINLHHASYTGTSTQVNKWSAGCQVIANIEHFNRMMTLAGLQVQHHPTWTKFTYTLLTADQV